MLPSPLQLRLSSAAARDYADRMTTTRSDAEEPAQSTRLRILDAALSLTQAEGPEAATTRAVAEAACVQVSTIYRLFGDKQGLLDAVAEHGVAAYVASKAERAPSADPVDEMRHGWDSHVAFGLANPGLFAIMSSHPRSPAAAEGLRILRTRIRAIAGAGRLRTSEERAVSMLPACCVGVVLTLVADGKTDAGDLSHATREAILSAITTDAAGVAPIAQQTAAAALRTTLDQPAGLSKGERGLLDELLERLSRGGS